MKTTPTRTPATTVTIVTAAKCPQWPHRHVVQWAINGLLTRLCGACGHCWSPTADELAREAA